jgi:predicted phosphoribosyltransferase
VAAPIAAAFGVPLGVVIARKLRAPHNPELAIGAVGRSGDAYVDRSLLERLRVTAAYLNEETARQREVIRERLDRYPPEGAVSSGASLDTVVVDDGVATGATLIAALRSVRAEGSGRLFCAVPVGPLDALRRLSFEADVVVCPLRPRTFAAVGEWYADFTQTRDDEVMALLDQGKA